LKIQGGKACIDKLQAMLQQFGEKYFDYKGVLPDCLNNPEKKIF
jgi:hypothetical protein